MEEQVLPAIALLLVADTASSPGETNMARCHCPPQTLAVLVWAIMGAPVGVLLVAQRV